MNKSESIAALASALAKAQSELKNPAFDSKNPHFKSDYASLASVRDTVIPILSKHELAVSQWPIFVEGHAGCRTVLTHSSGEWMEETLLIPTDKQNAHGVGSCVTYARRFSLMAVAGVVGDQDDDGNAAVESRTYKDGRPKPEPSIVGAISPSTGAWDHVAPERLNAIRDYSAEVIDMAAQGNMEALYTFLYTDLLDAGKIDNDEMMAIWHDLKAHSKVRRALKNMRDERTGKLAETA